MAILRLSTPEGHPIPPDSNPSLEIGRILLASTKLVVLDPGEYDLTPEIWTEYNHEHQIIVHYDGTGTYRMLPRRDGVGIMRQEDEDNQRTSRKEGGSNMKLPEDGKHVVITGSLPDEQGLGIFEVLIHYDINLRTKHHINPY